MNLIKIFSILLCALQLSAANTNDRLTDILYEDFYKFDSESGQSITNDEFLFRSMCFISAALWALKIGGPGETLDNYITQFGVFIAGAPIVAYFYCEYFNKSPSITREFAHGLFFLALKKYGAILGDEDFMKKNPGFPYYVYIPSNH